MCWIALQLLVIGYMAPPFQVGYLALGLLILVVALRDRRPSATEPCTSVGPGERRRRLPVRWRWFRCANQMLAS